MKKEKKIGKIIFLCDSEYSVTFKKLEDINEIIKVRIGVCFDKKIVPKPVIVRWTYPCKNIFSQWNPSLWSQRTLNPNWMPVKNASRSAESVPIQTHLSPDGKNTITVSLNDPLTPMEIATGIIEETAEISYKLTLFTKRISPIDKYEVILTIDLREIPYTEVIRETCSQWIKEKIYIPRSCTEPMYSTWYSYHQNLAHEELIKELKLAKALGMETVIIDDGWQTEDSSRGYAYCGDWDPIRLPDMKKFVSDVHKTGMKCILWFSVPFVGIHSEAWSRFEGKFLDAFDEKHPWCVLDPRYPEVRQYLIGIYENTVVKWHLDGLKLDFINNIQLTDSSSLPNKNMDYDSLEDAISALLCEIKARLTTINPDVMIEFRQPYTGPVMQSYGNMFRVADCPQDALKNRVGIIDLRLICGNSAVHSDMLMWNYDDSPESAALQFINVLFGVPQISVKIEKLTQKQRKMLEFYLSFWKRNKSCLLNGQMKAKNPETGYSIVSSETEKKLISVSYIKNVMKIEKKYEEVVFVNGSWEEELLINSTVEEYDAKYRIYDCMGNIAEQGCVALNKGINAFKVPCSGVLEIYK